MAKGAEPSRRHHTVPRFYLRGFAHQDRLATVTLPGDKRFVQSVTDATVMTDFYTLDGHPDGVDSFEKALSEIESEAAAILQRVIAGEWPLSRDDRASLGYHISLQVARVPVKRRSSEYVARQLRRLEIGLGGREVLRSELVERGIDVTDELLEVVWNQAVHPDGPPLTTHRSLQIKQILDTAEDLLPYIVGRPWHLFKFDKRSLITSDSPVSLIAQPDAKPWSGVGFMGAWGVTFPVSRKVGLLLGDIGPVMDAGVPVEKVWAGEIDVVQIGTTQMEKFFNGYTVNGASKWIFHHPDDGDFVPADLPDPRPVDVNMSGAGREFTGGPELAGDR